MLWGITAVWFQLTWLSVDQEPPSAAVDPDHGSPEKSTFLIMISFYHSLVKEWVGLNIICWTAYLWLGSFQWPHQPPTPHLGPRQNLQPVCHWSVLWSLLFSLVNDSEVPVVWGIFSTLTWMDLMKWASANKKKVMTWQVWERTSSSQLWHSQNRTTPVYSELRQPRGPVISALISITQSGLPSILKENYGLNQISCSTYTVQLT